jgi:hypothetical protein
VKSTGVLEPTILTNFNARVPNCVVGAVFSQLADVVVSTDGIIFLLYMLFRTPSVFFVYLFTYFGKNLP